MRLPKIKPVLYRRRRLPAMASSDQRRNPHRSKKKAPTVDIPPEKQQLIGVKTVVAEVKPMRKIIRTVGLVDTMNAGSLP